MPRWVSAHGEEKRKYSEDSLNKQNQTFGGRGEDCAHEGAGIAAVSVIASFMLWWKGTVSCRKKKYKTFHLSWDENIRGFFVSLIQIRMNYLQNLFLFRKNYSNWGYCTKNIYFRGLVSVISGVGSESVLFCAQQLLSPSEHYKKVLKGVNLNLLT